MKLNQNRVIVGMSGGVDSSVAAALLVEQGYEVIGITIKTYKYEDVGGNVGNDSTCCSLDGINDARRIAQQLGIPHFVVDFSEVFKKNVIDYFVQDYLDGNTPNPCVQCNRTIKWGEMDRKADSLGAQWIATGHYANIRYDEISGRYILSRDLNNPKDQTYALWAVSQDSLARTMFPLSGFSKGKSREEAQRLNLGIAQKPESYEICFIPDNDYNRFLRDLVPDLESRVNDGSIVLDGKEIGKHSGYPFYTVGQRRGLGVAHSEPLYVLNVLPQSNIVEVGTDEKLLHGGLIAESVNLIKYKSINEKREFVVKIRYKDEGAPALCYVDSDNKLHVDFHERRKAITPGQSVVMYEGNDVVGGGIITQWVN